MAVLFGDASGHGMAAGLVMRGTRGVCTPLEVRSLRGLDHGLAHRTSAAPRHALVLLLACYVLFHPTASYAATLAATRPS